MGQHRFTLGVLRKRVIREHFIGNDRQIVTQSQRFEARHFALLQVVTRGIVGIHYYNGSGAGLNRVFDCMEVDVPRAVVTQGILSDAHGFQPSQKIEQRIGRPRNQNFLTGVG